MMRVAVVAGVGTRSSFSSALLKRFLAEGASSVVALVRSSSMIDDLRAQFHSADRLRFEVVDLADHASTKRTFDQIEAKVGAISACVHNAARFVRAPFFEVTPESFTDAWQSNVLTAFNVAQAVLRPMKARGAGTLILTGATASLRGGGGFGAFASSKFALRGLAQSLAREFGPAGVHVAHVIVDGVIRGRRAQNDWRMNEGDCLSPDAMASSYLHLVRQPPTAWTNELDLRPSSEQY